MRVRKVHNQKQALGPWGDLDLYSIGWKSFQDLCAQVCEEVLKRPVQIFREAQDGGQDAVFISEKLGQTSDATIQCKHSSDPAKKLKLGDISSEIKSISNLVKLNQAHTYILITSMSVDAPVAARIRAKMRSVGVGHPHVFGKEFLVKAIRSSSRLRALVPQVYDLGDLSSILDERLIQQTRAMLDQWIPKVKLYVPTGPHRKAVNALSKNGIVLLLGNPSTGKSTIGAILSTIATESSDHTVIYATSPRDFEKSWNPHDRNRFFWIDDAFGSNVVRDDYVQEWASTFRKVQAAIGHGNRFLFTSRRHIYEAAKWRLGQRNITAFTNEEAVVNVGNLTIEEKAQILYNHIAFGNQTNSWKRSIKKHLDAVVAVEEFLPGIAERLGDPTFTKGLSSTELELIRFMEEPRGHLIDTINALDEALKAALLLIYVHQGTLFDSQMDDAASAAVAEIWDVPLPRIHQRMSELKGSFVRVTKSDGVEKWTFSHPTIADALTDILKERSHTMAAFLRGAPVETIMTSFVCEGAIEVKDAVKIPNILNSILASRLIETKNELWNNRSLFHFLAYRCNDDLIEKVIQLDPNLFERNCWSSYRIDYDPKIQLVAKVNKLGMLSDSIKQWASEKIWAAAIDNFDLSFFECDDLLSLVPPKKLIALGIHLRADNLLDAVENIEEISAEADLDNDPEENFENFQNGLMILSSFTALDPHTESLIDKAKSAIETAVEDISNRRAEKEEQEAKENEEDWNYMRSSPSATQINTSNRDKNMAARSISTDVDAIR